MSDERNARKRRTRRMKKAAEHLAYEQWGYARPNEQAVDNAALHIRRVVRALRASGFTVELDA